MSTIKVTNLQNASAASPAIVLDANSRATLNGLSYPTEGSLSGRNRIINGDMRIDQRNAGAALTLTAGYNIDRWRSDTTGGASFTVQRNAGSVTPPTGYTNYLGYTSTAAYTPATNSTFCPAQSIEGFNCADFAWGTASAISVTLSFWVRSSLTGSHSGSLLNGGGSRSYVFSYTVNAANTWEQKTIVIPGDTTGTWATDNTTGIIVRFNLGTGTGTFGSTSTGWQAGNIVGLTSGVQVSATNGATWMLTGVQLEAGSVATPFERRSYGQELALCQRYYAKSYSTSTVPGTITGAGECRMVCAGGVFFTNFDFPTEMRAAPTVTSYAVSTGASGFVTVDGIGNAAITGTSVSTRRVALTGTGISGQWFYGHYVASAEL